MPEINIGINASGAKRGANEVNKALNSVGKTAKETKNRGSSLGGLGMLAVAGGATAAAAAVFNLGKSVVSVTDKYTNYASQLEYVTGSSEGASKALEDLYRMSQNTATSVEANTKAMVLLSQANETTGNSAEDNVLMLQKLNVLMKKTGVDSNAASSSMLQLSQALASGVLSGDEYKSISEGFPALMQAIAKSLGVTKGELKALSTEQKLTSQVVVKAIQEMEGGYESLPKTASAGWQKVINSWEKALAAIGLDGGVSGLLYDAFSKLSGWMDSSSETFGPAIEYIKNILSDLWSQVKVPLSSLHSMLAGKISASISWLKTDGSPLVKAFGDIFKLVFKTIGVVVGNTYKIVKPILETMLDLIGLVFKQLAKVADSKIFKSAIGAVGGAVEFVGGIGSEDESDATTSTGTTNNVYITTPVNKDITRGLIEEQNRQGALL